MDAILRQKLETLDGSRGVASKSRAAVRRGDLVALVQLAEMKATQAVGAVTPEQFNALFAEVKAIRKALDQIAGAVK